MRGLAAQPKRKYGFKLGYKENTTIVLIKKRIHDIQDLNVKHSLTKEELLRRVQDIETDVLNLKELIQVRKG